MTEENGAWIMRGLDWNDPGCIHTYRELIDFVNQIGFLPLFQNEMEGFSAEEHVAREGWWTGDPRQDPWIWRELIARTGEVVYGKFFCGRAGFVSLKWFPYFANCRRDGYDFDARWEDELADIRSKKIMDIFENGGEYTGLELKRAAGFGKGGEKNFDGIMTRLQMQTYLVIKEFRRKRSKKGAEYGMPVCVYMKPEERWGYDMVTGAYGENPSESEQRIWNHVKALYPQAGKQDIKKLL